MLHRVLRPQVHVNGLKINLKSNYSSPQSLHTISRTEVAYFNPKVSHSLWHRSLLHSPSWCSSNTLRYD